MKIVEVDRNVPHFPHYEPFNSIPRAKTVFARHVLELKAGSPISKKLKIGDVLIIDEQFTHQEIHQIIKESN